MSGVVTSTLLAEPAGRGHQEETLQREIVQFLRWSLPADAVFFHIPNGMQRHKRAAARLVGLGVRAGLCDICIIYRGRPIFIELKTKFGTVSAVQKQMHQKLTLAGAEVFVLRTVEGVQNCLMELGVPLRGRLT